VLGLALAQLPAEDLRLVILVRTDIGGATQAFTADCREAAIRFSVARVVDHDTGRLVWAAAGSQTTVEKLLDVLGTEGRGKGPVRGFMRNVSRAVWTLSQAEPGGADHWRDQPHGVAGGHTN